MKRLSKLAFAAGSAILIVLVVYFGYQPIADAFAALGWSGLLISVAMHLPVVAIMGVAWWALMRTTAHVGVLRFIASRFIRDGAAEALPFSQVGGYVIGARALVIGGVSASAAAVSTLVDLILELAAKLPYVVIGIFLLATRAPENDLLRPLITGLIAISLLVAFLIAGRRPIYAAFERIVVRAADRFPSLPLGNADSIRHSFEDILGGGGRGLVNLVLHFTAWMIGGAETWVMLRLMGVPVDLTEAVVIDSLFTALRSFAFFVPGAIGLQEAAYVLVCGLVGVPPGTAIALSLLRRARDVAIAIPALLGWQLAEGRRFLLKPPQPRAD